MVGSSEDCSKNVLNINYFITFNYADRILEKEEKIPTEMP